MPEAVRPAEVVYAALAERFDSEEPGSLGRILRATVPGASVVPGWTDRDALILYRWKDALGHLDALVNQPASSGHGH